MDSSQLNGALVALLTLAGGPASKPFRALVVASDAQDLVVRLEHAPVQAPTEVLVIAGLEAGQRQARAIVHQVGPAEWRLTLRSGWRTRLDNRLEPRYPLFEDAVVRISATGQSVPARLVDLSPTGAALEMGAWPGGRELVLYAEWDGRRLEIPCQCILPERTWLGTTLHCHFHGLDPAVEELLDRWVDDLRQTFERVQTCLVYRVDDPLPFIAYRAPECAA